MRGWFSIWQALCLTIVLVGPSQTFGEGGCLVIEIPTNQPAVSGNLKYSVGEATSTSVPSRSKAKAQRRTSQAGSTLDDTQLKALILEQSASVYCDGEKIIEGDETGQRIR
jgi:hypothetical protein